MHARLTGIEDTMAAPASCHEYLLKGSMIYHPPSPTKPQDVLSCRGGVSGGKKKEHRSEKLQSPTARPPEAVRVEPFSPKLERDKLFTVELDREREDKNSKRDSRRGGRESRRRPPSGCTDVLLNLLGCQGSRTADSAVVPVARKRRDHGHDGHNNFRKSPGNSGKVSSHGKCKPVRSPDCSQCGKQFNPEKLHSHMKSCKAMKARAKERRNFDQIPSRTESNRTTEPSSQEFSRESISGLLMYWPHQR